MPHKSRENKSKHLLCIALRQHKELLSIEQQFVLVNEKGALQFHPQQISRIIYHPLTSPLGKPQINLQRSSTLKCTIKNRKYIAD